MNLLLHAIFNFCTTKRLFKTTLPALLPMRISLTFTFPRNSAGKWL